MSLTIEDGTGLAGAESYISVADATAYHSARGNAAWSGLGEPAQEQLLRKATAYMVQTYRQRWKGARASSVQALDWPRAGAVTDGYVVRADVVPLDVQHACAELAYRGRSGDLLADLGQGVTSKKVGSIAIEYDPNSQRQKRYEAVDRMLAPYLASSSSISVVRA